LKTLLAVAAVLCFSAAPVLAAFIDLTPQGNAVNSAGSVSLAALQADPAGGIVVGDKIFTGFSYSRIGDMPLPQDVLVLGFKDPDGNFGVSFHGAFLDLPGGAASDALIRFAVEVDAANQAQGVRISDAHLFLNGVGVGDESFFSVDESFLQNSETLNTFVSTLGPGPQAAQLQDVAVFPLVAKLNVTKDIFALAASSSNQPARATVIDQSFSQEVIPEPATMVLAGLSSLAIVVTSRRRRG
jgi:hypothetical protein